MEQKIKEDELRVKVEAPTLIPGQKCLKHKS